MKKIFTVLFILFITANAFAQTDFLQVRSIYEKKYGFKNYDILKTCDKPVLNNPMEVKVGKGAQDFFVCYSLKNQKNIEKLTLNFVEKGKNEIHQTMTCPVSALGYTFYDANFDGYQDLIIFIKTQEPVTDAVPSMKAGNQVMIHFYDKETKSFNEKFFLIRDPYFFKAKKLLIQRVVETDNYEDYLISSSNENRHIPLSSISFTYYPEEINMIKIEYTEYIQNPDPSPVYDEKTGKWDTRYFLGSEVKKVVIPSNYESLPKDKRKELKTQYNDLVKIISGVCK